MAFITVSGNVVSFAEYTDVLQKDQRLLEENEIRIPAESGFGDLQDFIEDMLRKSTQRILLKIKASTWWQGYNAFVGNPISDLNVLPNVNPNLIDPGNLLGRRQQFTDLCVYYAIKEYILPLVAQFGETSADMTKIDYYGRKFEDLYNELIAIADWYDFDNSGSVQDSEKAVSYYMNRRTRSKRNVVRIR